MLTDALPRPQPSAANNPGAAAGGRNRPHAVVIGSGYGGLAAAIRLGARGYRVTVLEKMDGPGGRGYTYKKDGFTFDAGPTVVTAPFLFEELWTMCGKRMADDIDLRPVFPFYRIRFDDGTTMDYCGDAQKMREEVAKISPDDVAGYERFLQASKADFEIGFEQMAHIPFDSWLDMAKVVPAMVSHEAYLTVYQMAAKHVRNDKLRQVLTFQSLLVGGNPFTTTSVYCMISYLERRWGVHFPMGGTGALARGMVKLIEGQGNRVLYGQAVTEILVDGDAACGVKLASGETVVADVVVSNADSAATYRNLLPARYRKRWTDAKIDRASYSMSLFVWYFGTKRQYPDVAHHTIAFGPRYRGLVTDIFKHKKITEDFSLYIHRPTATDPSLAPPGCDTFYALSPVPHLDSGTDWTQYAEVRRAAIQKRLEETMLPDLSNQIVTSHMLTPIDFRDRLSSLRGAAFGLAPDLFQSAWFRPHNRSEEVDRLYLVGAGTHPGAGLPGVLSTARVLDTVVPHGDEITARTLA